MQIPIKEMPKIPADMAQNWGWPISSYCEKEEVNKRSLFFFLLLGLFLLFWVYFLGDYFCYMYYSISLSMVSRVVRSPYYRCTSSDYSHFWINSLEVSLISWMEDRDSLSFNRFDSENYRSSCRPSEAS